MATFKEIVYMTLDLLKERSDDSYYTEEHILFLASKMRALLLERKLRQSRNSAYHEPSEYNLQEICIGVTPTTMLPMGCGGEWLKSDEKIPELLSSVSPKAYVISNLFFSPVTFIPSERMPYVGYNKWLDKIIYASRGADGYLYLKSNNSQFLYLESLKLSAVFSDPVAAAKMSCEGSEGTCDIMEMPFPLDEALIPECIEMVVNEIAGPRYVPDDRNNNAKDDLSDVGLVSRRAATPAADATDYRRNNQNTNEEAAK